MPWKGMRDPLAAEGDRRTTPQCATGNTHSDCNLLHAPESASECRELQIETREVAMILSPWFARAVILLASIVMIVIRAPHGQRSRSVPVAKSGKGPLETVLLTIAWATFFLTLLWVVTPLSD